MAGSDVFKSMWLLAILAICALSLCSDHKMVVPLMVAAEDCQSDLRGLEIECLYYMNKGVQPIQDPNDRCCKVIQAANIPCCCSKLNQKITYPPGATIEDMLNWDKVLHCFNFCRRPLAPGTKCGHFTVPPGPPPK